MKFRKGFVSNSSSSIFLVAFPCFPKNVEEVELLLFSKDQEKYVSPYYEEDAWPVREVAEIVFEDIKGQIPNNKNRIFCRISNVIIDELDEIITYDYDEDDREAQWAEYEARNKEAVGRFMSENDGSYFFIFDYADDDGRLGCAMEHGDLFSRLPHLISSNH